MSYGTERAFSRCKRASNWLSTLGLVLCAVIWPCRIIAQGDSWGQQSLSGVRTVLVVIAGFTPEAVATGIDTSGIRTDVEARLRNRGISIARFDQRTHDGVLFILAGVVLGSDGKAALSLQSDFRQPVALVRTPEIQFMGVTWQQFGGVGTVSAAGLGQAAGKLIGQRADEFGNAWLKANSGGE